MSLFYSHLAIAFKIPDWKNLIGPYFAIQVFIIVKFHRNR